MNSMRRLPALSLMVAALAVTACDAGGPESRRILLDQLAAQEAVWGETGSASYMLEMTRDCVCADDANRWQVSLDVVDDEVVSGVHVFTGEALTTEELALQYTVEDLFDVVRDALNRGVASVTISYNNDYGFVEQLYVDYDARISSDDVIIVVDGYTPAAAAGT